MRLLEKSGHVAHFGWLPVADRRRLIYTTSFRTYIGYTYMQWPFKNMAVGERVGITENIGRAQMYVHVYARQSGKRFITKTFVLADGSRALGVKRVS
jgi:hypothetical protein